jgi:putative ABC transport system substrate-binding protein
MRRRSVLVGGALTLLIAPKPSVSQQPQAKIPRVGVLTQASSNRAPMFDAFREGLRDLGYVEGSNIIIEFRFAGGDLSRGAELAAELGSIPVDVIVNEGVLGSTASSAMDSNGRIPIVSPVMVDPVGFGLAASLARPGGNVTGFTLMTTELNGKRVELLRDAFPAITTVAALVNPAQTTHKMAFAQTESAAQSLGLRIVRKVEAQNAQALRVLHPEVFSGADAVIVLPGGVFYNFRHDIIALINEARLPAIYPERDYADDGGLMAFGANVPDNFRRAAGYVDRILKGAKPGDLPIQEPVKFDFIVNLKTAKALGLTIPPTILARADEVIE